MSEDSATVSNINAESPSTSENTTFRSEQVFMRDSLSDPDSNMDSDNVVRVKIETNNCDPFFSMQRMRHASSQSVSSSRDSLFSAHETDNVTTSLASGVVTEEYDETAAMIPSASLLSNDPMLGGLQMASCIDAIVAKASISRQMSVEMGDAGNALDSPLLNAGPMHMDDDDGLQSSGIDLNAVRRSPPPPNVTLNPEKHKRNTMPSGKLEQMVFVF